MLILVKDLDLTCSYTQVLWQHTENSPPARSARFIWEAHQEYRQLFEARAEQCVQFEQGFG